MSEQNPDLNQINSDRIELTKMLNGMGRNFLVTETDLTDRIVEILGASKQTFGAAIINLDIAKRAAQKQNLNIIPVLLNLLRDKGLL